MFCISLFFLFCISLFFLFCISLCLLCMTDCSELFSTPTVQPNFQFCVNLAPASVATHMFLLGSPLLGCFGGVLEQIFFWLDFPRTGKSKFDIRKMSNLSVESSLYNWCFHWSDIYSVNMIIWTVLLNFCKINTFEINCLVSIVLSSDLCQKAKKNLGKASKTAATVQLWHLLWYLLDFDSLHSSVWWHLSPAKNSKKGRFRGLAKQPNLNRGQPVPFR